MFVTRIWGLTQSLRRHVLSQMNQSINLICLRPLALLHVKPIQSRSLVVVQALSLRMKVQFLMPGCFHLGNMREDLHGFIIMWRKGAIVASYVRYFVHFCQLCKCFNKRCYCVKLIVFPFLPLRALISSFERPRHHSPKTEKKHWVFVVCFLFPIFLLYCFRITSFPYKCGILTGASKRRPPFCGS